MKPAVCFFLIAASCGGGAIPSISPGRPPFRPNSPEAYWIWHDEAGWHLRTTTTARLHRFHGRIEAVDGQISQLHATRLEWNDRVQMVAGAIEFDFSTDGSEDGFDWRVTSGCNRFNLQIDGTPRPELTHLGGANHSPVEMPFRRCR